MKIKAMCVLMMVCCALPAAAEGLQPLAPSMLEELRGRADWQSNEIVSSGSVAQNEASNILTGSNFVNGGAFSQTTGFPTVVQNSGNNVLIQNSTIINLQLQ
jgi:hypothetical protein